MFRKEEVTSKEEVASKEESEASTVANEDETVETPTAGEKKYWEFSRTFVFDIPFIWIQPLS